MCLGRLCPELQEAWKVLLPAIAFVEGQERTGTEEGDRGRRLHGAHSSS